MAAGEDLHVSCHCGQTRIHVARKPDLVLQCNCSLCTKTGFRGVYFSSDELAIDGEFDSYVRDDIKEPFLATYRCANCGIITHWTPLSDPPHERMGVNARLFDEAVLEGVPVQQVDGRSWDG
jgi:hypothetical protein